MASERIYHLNIGGIRIRIRGAQEELFLEPGPLEPFLASLAEFDHDYLVWVTDRLELPSGEPIYRAANQWVYRSDGNTVRLTGPMEQGADRAHIRISRFGQDLRIAYLWTEHLRLITPRLLLNALDLEHLLTIHDGFLLHASFIESDGGAILFTAPSGTGKSTQAQLWCEHRDAELMNGDRTGVRIVDGNVVACGVPFSGSSDVRRSGILPLKAIVYLSQAPENTITRLRGVRAFRRVWEGCTLNIWDSTDVDLAVKTVTEVISKVPVYHLACTPDVRAVELLEETMEGTT